MIPENNNVGLITFGTHVHVHELGYAECSKAFVFRGSKEYNSSQVHGPQGGLPGGFVGWLGGSARQAIGRVDLLAGRGHHSNGGFF